MKKTYNLREDEWRNDFFYCYGPQAKSTTTVYKKRDANGALVGDFDAEISGYDYISALTNKKYSADVTATLKCSYRGSGAPLIVFSDDMSREGTALRYALHFEVVAHKGGCNVWHVLPRPENPEWPVRSTKIGCSNFSIEDDEEIIITATIKDKTLYATVNGVRLRLENADIPDSFHIGFTVCEGYCTVSEFAVEGRTAG